MRHIVRLITLALALQGAAFLGFAFGASYPALIGWALAYGVGYASVSVLFPALTGDLFGRAHTATIAGAIFAIGGGAAALGPYLAGAVHDAAGSYTIAFVSAAVLNLAAVVLVVPMRVPARPAPGSSA